MKVSDTTSIKGCRSSLLIGIPAHHIRNRSSQTFKAACAVHSQRRWCLTGTPIQNSLDDYGALLSFLTIAPFKDKSKFDFWVATPLKKGRADSLRRLKDLIRATCLRRTKLTLGSSCELPKRTERIEWVEFHETDQQLYSFFQAKCAKLAEDVSTTKLGSLEASGRKEGNLLSLINFLRRICDHGEQLLSRFALDAWKARDDTSLNLQTLQSCQKRCCICEVDAEEADFLASDGFEPRCQRWICAVCALQSESTSEEEGLYPGLPSLADTCLPPSAKIEALLRNLHTEQAVTTCQRPSKPVKRSVILTLFKCYYRA
jgi:SNF2 family DNA or RNA helicase